MEKMHTENGNRHQNNDYFSYCFSFSTPIFRENQSDSSFIHNFSLIGEHTQNVQRGECLAMHGALVAIGTRSGTVFVYHLNGKWKDQVSNYKPKNS